VPDAAAPPLGCAFHPRCPVAFESCGWESRDLADLLERHWVRPTADYETERPVVGSLEALEVPSTTAKLAAGSGRMGADLEALLGEIRQESPSEPLWKGVSDIAAAVDSVTVTFRDDFVDPPLYDVGGTKVACLKYREEPQQPAE
jgi:peptide/nickel transport system ATP-binding protein